MTVLARDNLPGAVIAAGGVEEPKLAEPVKEVRQAGARKPMAVLCHAPGGLVPGGLARGRTLTPYHTLQDDLPDAGATGVDREMVVHGTLVTSRQPSDVQAFTRELPNLAAARGA